MMLIGAFVDWIRAGNSPSGKAVVDQTLRNYIKSAGYVFSLLMTDGFTLYDSKKSTAKSPRMWECLSDRLSQHAAWARPRDKKEPLTYPVFVELSRFSRWSYIREPFLSKEAVVYDTACLGCFTSSHVSECAQDGVPRGQHFNVILHSR